MDSRSLGVIPSTDAPKVSGAEAERANGAVGLLRRWRENVAPTSADRRLGGQLIGEADARREIVGVPDVLRPRVAVRSDEHQAAASDWDIREPVPARGERALDRSNSSGRSARCGVCRVVAEAQVQGQFLGDAPVVLEIQGGVQAVGRDILEALMSDPLIPCREAASDGVAAVGGGRVGVGPCVKPAVKANCRRSRGIRGYSPESGGRRSRP